MAAIPIYTAQKSSEDLCVFSSVSDSPASRTTWQIYQGVRIFLNKKQQIFKSGLLQDFLHLCTHTKW